MNKQKYYETFQDQELLLQFKGDEDILIEMIGLFIDSIQNFLKPLREAVNAKDREKIKLFAHNLKGATSNFYASSALELVKEIEILAETAQFEQALLKLIEIEDNIMLLIYELTHFKKSLTQQALL